LKGGCKLLKYHIYCHIPFCKKRCRYCYFTAKYDEGEVTNLKKLDNYVLSFVQDILNTDIPKGEVQTIVFGGGTPSLLSKEQLDMIMGALHSKLSEESLKKTKYMAYEVSPDTASYETLSNFRNHGFNRISIGIQSFDDKELRIIGRPYNKDIIIEAFQNIRKLKYNLINIDLLVGTPGQTRESVINSVRETIKLRPEHISISLFYKSYPGGSEFVNDCLERGYSIFSLDEKMEVYEQICREINESGYQRVDNTVFSLPGYNFDYEKDSISGTESVLAFGPGSSGYWQSSIRYTPPEIQKYIDKPESVCKEFSIETNAYATIWGHLNAYGYIKEEEIRKNFNYSIEHIIESDESVNKLITDLKDYGFLNYSESIYSLKKETLNSAIVLMQHNKDEWGYRLITAPKKKKEEEQWIKESV
jgi:Coproporphyrinogen III oxidase and related Fe-S oxidoreductases